MKFISIIKSFLLLIIFMFLFCNVISYASEEEIDINRLIKALNSNQSKLDKIKRQLPQDIQNQIGNQNALQIPQNIIVADIQPNSNPLVGSAIKLSINPNFVFGNGNLRQAILRFKVSNGQSSRDFPLTVNGGIVSNFSNVFYEFKPNDAGQYNIQCEIEYKVFGNAQIFTAISPAYSVNFVGGNANINNPNPNNNVLPQLPPGQNTPPGTISKKIPIHFSRQGGPPDINERQNYTWQWPQPQITTPASNPGSAYAFIIATIQRGFELSSNDIVGISSSEFNGLSQDDQKKYVVGSDGRYYLKAGIDVGGGPIPGTLKPEWKVFYPSVTNNNGNWEIKYDIDKNIGGSGENFTTSMPEPSEPFKVKIGMKVKHTWRQFIYDKNPNEFQNAIEFYNKLKSGIDPNGQIIESATKRNIIITPNQLSCSGGNCEMGPSAIAVTISGNASYEEYVKVGEKITGHDQNGNPIKEDIMDWVPKQTTISKTFQAGKIIHNDFEQYTDEAVCYEKVLDTTAPKIEFAPQVVGNVQSLNANGEIICTTGDLIMVRVKISDNNRYSALRTPYLTYETAPSGNNPGQTWSATPLMMEATAGVPDNNAPRPFANGNWGYFQALVPAPHNVKGEKAIKWFVDAFDGASYKQPQKFNGADAYGNHNHGDFTYNGIGPNTQKVEGNNSYGYLTIYDNDRPNINLKIWRVDRAGIYLIGECDAGEDYFIEDFYYNSLADMIDSSAQNKFKAQIPEEKYPNNVPGISNLLDQNDSLFKIPGKIYWPTNTNLLSQDKKKLIAQNLKYQICDSSTTFFKYYAGYNNSKPTNAHWQDSGCPVMFEDVKYIFTVDAYDNIEAVANNGIVTPLPKTSQIKISFTLKDTTGKLLHAEKINFSNTDSNGTLQNVTGDAQRWYLGPADPSLAQQGNISNEVPTFEYIFHSASPANASFDHCYLKITAYDDCDHERNLYLALKISEVTNELRVIEEKIKRDKNIARRKN